MPKKLPILNIDKRGRLRVTLSSSDEVRDILYALLQLIKIGKVATYGLLARCLGIEPRSVANILKKNPYPIIIPCHRVVKSDLSLGGYTLNGRKSPHFKKKLLILEGVCFDSKERVRREYVVNAVSELLS
ncbi:MAG: cysteine methyltransferase [Thermoprotei archaeon]|nr:MAG: cysteine methyltransferase [Thermoprotei archaeon]